MGKTGKFDFAKLLGFDSVHRELLRGVDFQDDSMSAKLGAKVGTEICLALDLLPAASGGNTAIGDPANEDD